MKRKVFNSIIAFVVILAVLPMSSFAAMKSESVVFIDTEEGAPVNEISDSEKIHTEVSFTPEETGKAHIITAGYDSFDNMVTPPVVDTVDVVAGETTNLETTPIAATGAEAIKVFVWNLKDMSPILERKGEIKSVFSEIGRNVKLNALAGKTEENAYTVVNGRPFNASKFFEASAGAEINSKYFSISAQAVNGSEASAEFVPDASDWTKSTIKFSGTGVIKLTAQDYDFCIPTVAYVNVINPIDRYTTKFDHTNEFLYRVGNLNSVNLESLFKAEPSELPVSGVKATIDDSFSGDATGAFTENADWPKGSIKFSGTGVVSVTIQDDYSNPVTLMLEVVDAKNITKAESATANDVVLLNNTSGTFVVSGGHTFYGNGFTVTLPTTSAQNVGQGYTGYISIGSAQDDESGTGGNLDNVRIEGPVYPEMYIYREQAKITDKNDPDYGDGYNMHYFRNSVIVYGGNCKISNSYISGSRTALCLRAGNNVEIENTTLSGGAYANMEICAGSSVTLRNLTTVQTDVQDSYGKDKMAHGLGIAVASDVVDIFIEGELKQYNWLSQAQWNKIVPSSYQSSFPNFFTNDKFSKYWHYLNGGTAPYVNMAFIYACNWDTSKIHDNRIAVNYDTCASTISGVAGGVYSKVNTVGGNAIADSDLASPVYVSTGFNPVSPVLNFDNTANNDDDDQSDAADTYCVYNESAGILKIGMNSSSKTIDLSGVTVTKNGSPLSFKKYLNGAEISGNTVNINAANGAKQVLTFKATTNDCGYDKDGNAISGSIDYSWTVTVEVATLAYPAPVWNMGGDYEFDKTNCVYAYFKTSQGYGEAVPIYEGIKVNYYDKSGKLVELNLSGTTTHPTGSNNSNANAFTYTLADGSFLTMKLSSGWKSGASTHQFATYKNKVYIYPQSLDNDNYVRAKVGNQDFDVKISYTFTDPNGQSVSETMRWYNAKATNGSVSTVQWKDFDSVHGKKDEGCFAEGTLITLADGSQKTIEELTFEDEILVWDFFEGKYTTTVPSLLINDGVKDYNVITLNFNDGTSVRTIYEHGFFDVEENDYVLINEGNVESFVGHKFIKNKGLTNETVVLDSYEITKENVGCYTILTAQHNNCIANGMLTVTPPPVDGWYDYFEIGEGMKYDKVSMEADIAKYGLYTYDDFKDYITYEEFVAFNGAYLKILVEKGYFTFEEILEQIEVFGVGADAIPLQQ